MINMDQVRTLELKVKQTVQLIVHLRQENDSLRGKLSDTEVRLQELELLLEGFKATQNEMESGIRSALQELDNLENASEAVISHLSVESQPAEESMRPVSPGEMPLEATVETVSQTHPVPPSVELEDEEFQSQPEDTPENDFIAEGFSSSEAESDEPEPQQPGLGIF